MRCVRLGHKCEGYAYLQKTGVKPTLVTNIAPRALIPRTGHLLISPATSPTSVTSTSSSIISQPETSSVPPPSTTWRDRGGEACFRNFVREITGNSGHFEVWWGLIFSGCQSSSLVFDAVHMIGSLDLRPKNRGNHIGTFRHMSTYREYCSTKCLTKKRTVPFSKDPGRSEEVMEVNMESRITLIAHLLSNMRASGNEVISHERVSTMYLGLRRLREWVVKTYIPQGGHLGTMTESACLKCFNRLELKILRYADAKPEHERRINLGQPDIEMMPGRFSTLIEAKKDLEKVMMKSMDWLASTLKRHDFAVHHNDLEDYHEHNGSFFDIDPKFEEEKRTLREYERWNRSFSSLFEDRQKRCQSNDKFHCEKDPDLLLAYLLRMTWLAGYILIASSNHLDHSDIKEGRFSGQLQELREIAKILHATPSWKRALEDSGEFETTTVVPSMVVGWGVRDKDLRGIAIALLKGNLARSWWDYGGVGGTSRGFKGAVGLVMERLVRIDEEGIDGEGNGEGEGWDRLVEGKRTFMALGEENSCRDIEIGFDALARVAYLRCYKGASSTHGLAVFDGRREIIVHC